MTMLGENFQIAVTSIRANRLRSLVTMSGIIIGVVGVVTSFSLSEGVKQQINETTGKVGANVITVRPGRVLNKDQNGIISGINTLATSTQNAGLLTQNDVDAISNSENISTVAPLGLLTGVASIDGKNFNQSVVIGTNENLPDMLKQKVRFGGFFYASDEGKQVATIGANVADELFDDPVPLGDNFILRGKEFIVRGVFDDFRTSAISPGIDLNDAIFIPSTTARALRGNEGVQYYEVLAKVKDKEDVDAAATSITSRLEKLHGGEVDFTVLKPSESAQVSSNLLNLITTTVSGVALVAMLVGGIGIMNIMLVSVTERTREIGIRKAIGASDKQIGNQFLVEAATISVWGAAIGVVISGILNVALRLSTNLNPVIVWPVVVAAALFSIFIGVLFGAAPAIKAAKKDPIEALRS
jgi:ABC-type antimicrobial peptide transport system permease subunit